MKRKGCKSRPGMSLLEMMIASSMLAVLLTAMSVVLRTGRQSWEAHEADYTRLDAMHSTVRHIVRQVWTADAVTAISAANATNGNISLKMKDGTTQMWSRDGNNFVWCGVGAANQLLANNISRLQFEGLQADGVTPTTVVDQIQCLRVTVGVQLPRETGGAKSVTTYAWIRSW